MDLKSLGLIEASDNISAEVKTMKSSSPGLGLDVSSCKSPSRQRLPHL